MDTNYFFLRSRKELHFSNKKSSLKNVKSELDFIIKMLKIGSIKEGKAPPKGMNPLFVSDKSAGKKRLIFDLSYINEHLYKDKIKFDDWKCFENYLEPRTYGRLRI